jgi:hypothetical protein
MTVVAALLAVAGSVFFARPAAATPPPPIPPDVTAWFQQQAPVILDSQTLQDPQATPDPDRLIFPFGSTLGKLVPVMVWNDAFLDAATPSIDMLTPLGNWMAPVIAHGTPVGTFTVDDTNGAPGWMANDDADAAALMVALKPGDMIATDGHSGFFVVSGKTARQARISQYGIADASGTLQQFQGALRQQRDQIAAMVAANHGQLVAGAGAVDLGAYINSETDVAHAIPAPSAQSRHVARGVTATVAAGLVLCVVGAALLIGKHRRSRTFDAARHVAEIR